MLSIRLILGLLLASQSFAETLHRGNGSEVDSLHIHQAQGLNSHNVLRDMYEGLMTLNAKGEPIYGVAKKHEVVGNTWVFQLRDNAFWSDGKPLQAADFVRAWQQAIDPQTAAPYAFLFSAIKNGQQILKGDLPASALGIKAVNDFELHIELVQQDFDFLEKLTLPIFYPLPSEQNSQTIISNGAYQLSQRVLQEKIVLSKNQHFHSHQEIYFDEVVYWAIENQASELKRFRAQELDITESVPDSQIPWIQAHLPKQLRIAPYLGSFFLGLNLNDENLKNIHLRKALYYAIDRTILVEKVLKSGQKEAYSVVPEAYIKSAETVLSRPNQIQLAKDFLEKSGVNPKTLNLQILYNNSMNQKKVALAVAAMWRQTLGIKSQLKNQEWKVFTQTRKSNNKQVFRSGWIADYSSPMSFLELFESASRFNFYGFKNSEYDHLVSQARNSSDLSKRKLLLTEAQNLLMQELPVIPLYFYVSRHLVAEDIKGFEDNISDRHLTRYLHN